MLFGFQILQPDRARQFAALDTPDVEVLGMGPQWPLYLSWWQHKGSQAASNMQLIYYAISFYSGLIHHDSMGSRLWSRQSSLLNIMFNSSLEHELWHS